MFFFEVSAGLIAGRAGCRFDAAQNDLAAYIGLPKMITMNTEVPGIIKSTFMIPVRKVMSPHLFRDCGRVFEQETSDILKGCVFVLFIFDVNMIFESKMFLVAGNIFAHGAPSSTAFRGKITIA